MGGINMKVSELQIGDWVKISRHEKVVGIQNISVASPDHYNITTKLAGESYHRKKDEVESIPLTKEIMDANLDGPDGWKYDGIRYTWANTFSKSAHLHAVYIEFIMDQATLCVYERKSTMSHSQEPRILGMKISYVHELQHALRLCGLSELADNLKI